MPILNDIMHHDLFGPKIREGIAIGMEQGMEQGLQRGVEAGERKVVAALIEQRFGPLPSWARTRVESLRAAEIESMMPQLLTAATLEDLLAAN